MKNIYKISIRLCFILCFSIVNAQQDPGYTQYMYNPLVINPGYTGSTGSLEAVLLHRSQWVGIDGAPETQSLTVHSPLRNEKLGLGFSAVNDKLGPSNELFLDMNFSYTLNLNYDLKLAFGIKGGARILNIDWSKGRFYDQQDALLNDNIRNKLSPALGAGAFLYKDNWYVGLSVPNFIRDDYYDDIQESVDLDRLHYYVLGGYVWNITDAVKFKPAFMVKLVSGAPVSPDVSANFMFNEKFVAGLGYRWDDSVSLLAGFQLNQDFFIGYSFDYTTSELTKYNDGTHEIMLRYQFTKKSTQVKSQRFF